MRFDLVIKNGFVHTANGFIKADVAVANGKIASIGILDDIDAVRVIDAAEKHVLPGMIDFHTHIREPGRRV